MKEIKYCCLEMDRFMEDAPRGLLSFDKNTMMMQLEGAWDSETWDDKPFKIKYCPFCGNTINK